MAGVGWWDGVDQYGWWGSLGSDGLEVQLEKKGGIQPKCMGASHGC